MVSLPSGAFRVFGSRFPASGAELSILGSSFRFMNVFGCHFLERVSALCFGTEPVFVFSVFDHVRRDEPRVEPDSMNCMWVGILSRPLGYLVRAVDGYKTVLLLKAGGTPRCETTTGERGGFIIS